MRKLILILINLLFINAAFSQSYIEPLNKLNEYLKNNEYVFKHQLEVKDGYLYVSLNGKEFAKIYLKDLGNAVPGREGSKYISVDCVNNKACVSYSDSKKKETQYFFDIIDEYKKNGFTNLINDFINSYDKDFGIVLPVEVIPAAKPTKGCIWGDCVNGKGKFVYEDSTEYSGSWKNGKREGKGTITKNDKTWIYCNWLNDESVGTGTINYKNGDRYEGAIKNNLANGDGIMYSMNYYKKDNTTLKGVFTDDKINGTGEYYNLTSDAKHYYERVVETYNGNFKDGLYDGYGIYELKPAKQKSSKKDPVSIISYEGEWKKGKKEGFGKYYDNRTYNIVDEYTGRWKNGEKYDALRDSLYSEKDKAIFKIRIDSLKDEIIKADNLLTAYYQQDINLAKQKKYGELLAGKKWVGEKSFLQDISYDFGDGHLVRTITTEFKMRQEIEFVAYEKSIDAKITENLILPRAAQKLTNGGFVLFNKYGANQFGDIDYYSESFVTSSYTTSMMNFNWPEFKLSYSPYSSDYADVNKKPLYNNNEYCKSFIDKYMIYLTKCNFKFFTTKEGKIVLRGTDNTGSQIDFDYANTPAQQELKNKKYDLEIQISVLEKLIAKTN